MKEYVEKYINELHTDNHRYLSWEHCYKAFGNSENSIDYLALHLAFYLASWGMYRGSTTLLKKDYKVHYEVVKLIKPVALNRESIKSLTEIQGLMHKIFQEYDKVSVKASKTLQTKILLGTLGCFPALDRFFIDGWNLTFESNPTDENIFSFVQENISEIENCQKIIGRNMIYPPMKIVDMYFWQKGYDKYLEGKRAAE
jgi:hypothetical protein|uniref:Uncharacterized protein n=1 Tax=Siphoviridae sp. ctDcW16 TaxID=2826199 RepID=A0A8S5MT56_9CAUD|nr:MAG TPA: hypothetical protein [Siphoviridae sp. ctDcW16]